MNACTDAHARSHMQTCTCIQTTSIKRMLERIFLPPPLSLHPPSLTHTHSRNYPHTHPISSTHGDSRSDSHLLTEGRVCKHVHTRTPHTLVVHRKLIPTPMRHTHAHAANTCTHICVHMCPNARMPGRPHPPMGVHFCRKEWH